MKGYKILLVVFILVFVTGCSSQKDLSENIDSQSPEVNIEDIGQIEIFYPLHTIITPPIEYVWEWQRYMRDKFNLDIKLTYTNEIDDGDVQDGRSATTGIDLKAVERNSSKGGFIYSTDEENLWDLVESGMIVPVNEYIKDVSAYNGINERVLAQYMDQNNNIWVLPVFRSLGCDYRAYNQEWLKKWGKPVPDNIGDFLDYATYVKNEDPDNNGEDDSYIMMYNISTLLMDFHDIFAAYGCYTEWGAINVNPQKGVFEIALLNENFKDAFLNIKYMYKENMIMATNTTLGFRETDGFSVATAHRQDSLSLLNSSSITGGYYLKGSNTTDLIRVMTSKAYMAVMKGTEYVPEKLNILFGESSKSQDCIMSLRCGIEGKSYTKYSDYYSYFFRTPSDDRIPLISIYLDMSSGEYEKKPIIVGWEESELNVDEEIENIETSARIIREGEIYYDSNLAYSISYLMYSNKWNMLNRNLRAITTQTLSDMLNDIVSIDDGIEMYRIKLKQMGALSILDELNEELGGN